MRHLSVLGSTGSIGTRALDVVRMYPDRFSVKVLTAAGNIELLARQIEEFKPEMVAVLDETGALKLAKSVTGKFKPTILYGETGYEIAAAWETSDVVLLAMVGAAGLKPALAALDAKKQIALANKETLVMAGQIVMDKARENGVDILPVDSEHSAIFQCLRGNREQDFKRIFLTASGGPFRNLPIKDFKTITLGDALNHPTWNMGPKITIDSATMMNKGLEVIEAVHLFGVSPDEIEVLVHPESIVHSMVGFTDGIVLAQMGIADMKAAIAYALSQPGRLNLNMDFPDFAALNRLTFDSPDPDKFPSLGFAFEACKQKGTMPAVLNASNEVAVQAFLEKKIGFLSIFDIVSSTMGLHRRIDNPDLSGIIEADSWAREKAKSLI
ncbi:MAG: 1-deoxy-D-xylulose-5-phosphate reductoisomerase [Desulfobacteraceae bacterium]|nr:1-deoxy-D-xylulose-5-phosphate reductoisomerase [Desulfobacteraceae bacterium]